MAEALHIGVLGGTTLPGNVRTLLTNLRRLLRRSDRTFDCDLLVSSGVDTPVGYRPVRLSHGPVETARDRLRVLLDGTTRYLTDEQPDVFLQLTRFPTHGTAAAVAGRRTGIPTITRLAGDNFSEYRFDDSVTAAARTFALKNVIGLAAVHFPDAVIALGPNGRRDLRRRLRRRDVYEIPQPVDRSQFSPGDASELRDELGVDASERMVLTVGRIDHRKGAETIRRVAPSHEGVWVVVGDGPMRETLADVQGVHTTGRVPHERIVDYYRAADLYVHPSLHEGLPNVLLEATACGTPCIARDVGECGTVAVETFSDDDGLRTALDRSYGPTELDERFGDEHLARAYESMLTEVAN